MTVGVSSLRKVAALPCSSDEVSTFNPSDVFSKFNCLDRANVELCKMLDDEMDVDKEAPLPTQRELAKLLCKIIDDAMYSKATARSALKQIQIWAVKDETGKFSKDFVDVGGVQITLNFLEDNMTDVESVQTCLAVLHALIQTADHSTCVPETFIAQSGADVLLKAFEVHLLKSESSDNSRSMLDSIALWKAIGSFFKNKKADEDLKVSDGDTVSVDSSTSGTKTDQNLAHFETAVLAIETLRMVIPHATPEKASSILEKVYNYIPKVSLQNDRMMAAVTSCLVEALKYPLLNDPTQVVRVTTRIMKHYSHHEEVLMNGCLILQEAGSKVSKEDRKKLGIVATLGNILASDTTSKEVKDVADKALEELYQVGSSTEK